MATKVELKGRAGQTQCKFTMRHSLTPFRCYYQKIRRRKRKEEKEKRERREKGGEEGEDVMVKCGERLKPLFHTEEVNSASTRESAWRCLKTIKTEAHDPAASK